MDVFEKTYLNIISQGQKSNIWKNAAGKAKRKARNLVTKATEKVTKKEDEGAKEIRKKKMDKLVNSRNAKKLMEFLKNGDSGLHKKDPNAQFYYGALLFYNGDLKKIREILKQDTTKTLKDFLITEDPDEDDDQDDFGEDTTSSVDDDEDDFGEDSELETTETPTEPEKADKADTPTEPQKADAPAGSPEAKKDEQEAKGDGEEVSTTSGKGEGDIKNKKEGFRWMEMAAENGSADACKVLSQLYQEDDGLKGVYAQDMDLASKYAQKAKQIKAENSKDGGNQETGQGGEEGSEGTAEGGDTGGGSGEGEKKSLNKNEENNGQITWGQATEKIINAVKNFDQKDEDKLVEIYKYLFM